MYDPEHCTKAALEALLSNGMTFYDLGAKLGLFSALASSLVGPTGYVLSVEPLPDNFGYLQEATKLFENVHRECVAICGHDGEAKFLTSSNSSEGTLIEGEIPSEQYLGSITVPTKCIDTLMKEHRQPDVVKMDLEAAEILALAGAHIMLTKARPLMLIEIHNTAEKVADILHRYDYSGLVFGYDGPIRGIKTNKANGAHVLAIPSEREGRDAMMARFGAADFPTCFRCKAYRTDYAN